VRARRQPRNPIKTETNRRSWIHAPQEHGIERYDDGIWLDEPAMLCMPDNVAYCGPTAISAVTGCSIQEVETAIQSFRGDRLSVKGITDHELVSTLDQLNCAVVETGDKNLTLAKFMQERGYSDGPFIVGVDDHYVAISCGEICDTQTGPVDFNDWEQPELLVRMW
jgi:hypothetical protein